MIAFRRRSEVVAVALTAWVATAASSAAAELPADLRAAVRQRREALRQLSIEATFAIRTAPIRTDPFNPDNWTIPEWEGTGHATYHFWLDRPSFRFTHQGGERGSMQGRSERSWHAGRLVSKGLTRDGATSVIVSPTCWPSHGPLPFLMPLELHFFEIEESWLDWVENNELRLVERVDDRLVLAGGPFVRTPRIPPWECRLEIDLSRGCLPTFMTASLVVSDGTIQWSAKTLAAQPVAGVWMPTDSVMALKPIHPDTRDRWAIYRFTVDKWGVNDRYLGDRIVIPIPDRNVDLLDRTTGLSRIVDAHGVVVHEHQRTLEELERDQMEMQQDIAAANKSRQALATRKRALPWILAAALGATVLVVGFAVWKRYRVRPT